MKDPLFVTGVMDHKDVEDKKQTRGLRRAFGAAGIRLNSFLASGDFYAPKGTLGGI